MAESESIDTKSAGENAGDVLSDESRRTFMKKGALATGALALGLGSAGTATAQRRENVLVYTYAYHPNVPFRITNALEASTVVRLLRRPGGGDVAEISQPDEYSGWVIRYDLGGPNAALTALMFARDANFSRGERYRFSGDATIFSSELNLLSTTARRTF
ncbi:twin-arginine translocation signal domain-containing protein [Haladaptatus caseinilyticus]|uniref:twin-arginine translocation signal domain-containing protein n=1 Tax=Haladaptatus caseinilyticus TaxID=2993314 RepID=UPI00224AC327|nr:twin-arginine translocation signal domain-containing protein [Haladaptatus caseinilyticus]